MITNMRGYSDQVVFQETTRFRDKIFIVRSLYLKPVTELPRFTLIYLVTKINHLGIDVIVV